MKNAISLARKKIIPSKRELIAKSAIAKHALECVMSEISSAQKIRGVELGGSFAKGTWLDGADVDIFVKFDVSVSEKNLEVAAKKIGFASMRGYSPSVRYASHPYVEAVIKKTKVNVVPCYGVKHGQWKSAADRSMFHTAFMKKNLTPRMQDDVRVLKKMLQTNGLYGAELALQAFSGYSCEVLIHNYKTLEKTVRALASATLGTVIGNASSKPKTDFAIMDPIDPTRNLATAVSVQNVGRLIMLCRTFEKKPTSAIILTRPRVSINQKLLKNTVAVKFTASKRSPETIWGQAKKAATALASRLDANGFGVMRYGAHVTDSMKVTLGFVLDSLSAPQWSMGFGPQYFDKQNSLSFTQKNAKHTPLVWVGEDSRLRTLRAREYATASELLNDSLSKNLRRSGMPSGLVSDVRAGFVVRAGLRKTDRQTIAALSDLVSTDMRTIGVPS